MTVSTYAAWYKPENGQIVFLKDLEGGTTSSIAEAIVLPAAKTLEMRQKFPDFAADVGGIVDFLCRGYDISALTII